MNTSLPERQLSSLCVEGKDVVCAPLMSSARFERFFRAAAGLDVFPEHLDRYSDFVQQEVHGLLRRAQATAKANGREVIEPFDLPITRGLQECIYAFERLDERIDLDSLLAGLARLPPLDLPYGSHVVAKLSDVVGGLSVALARSLKVINPLLRYPQSKHWDTAFRLFALVF